MTTVYARVVMHILLSIFYIKITTWSVCVDIVDLPIINLHLLLLLYLGTILNKSCEINTS